MRCTVGKEQDNQKSEYDLDRLLRGSFGCDDEQLLQKMQMAEETVDDSQIPPASEDGFERVMAEAEKRGLQAHYRTDGDKEETEGGGETKKGGGRKVRCIKPIIRVALAFGILASVLALTSIQAGAKRSYEYGKSSRGNAKNDAVVNNEMNSQKEGSLIEAYEEIHDQTGINVLMLGDRPADMKYEKTAISKRHATIIFSYEGNYFYFIQQLMTVENSSNIVSDRNEDETVYNKWTKREIAIEKAVTENNEVEYSAQINEGNAYYYLSGIMSEEDFRNIVANLRFME